jgi:hypothetical protein
VTTGDFNVHWGRATTVDDCDLASNIENKIDSGLPWAEFGKVFVYDNDGDGTKDDKDLPPPGNGTPDFDAWLNHADKTIEDPWLTYEVGGDLVSAPNCDPGGLDAQPFPFGFPDSDPGCTAGPYDDSNVDPDANLSNIFIHVDRELCPSFDYGLWKTVATSGRRNTHYFQYDAGSGDFLQDGMGAPVTMDDATSGRTGLFFFDTTDARPPRDDNDDGRFDNLTPNMKVQASGWWTGGFIYFNGRVFQTTGLGNVPDRGMRAPGEPFYDLNSNLRYDSNEPFLKIQYPANYTQVNAAYRHNSEWQSQDDLGAGYTRLDDGPSQMHDIHLYGVMYTSGQWDPRGNGLYYGSLIARSGIGEMGAGAAGTPDVFFDERLIKGQWPPKELRLPRVYVSEWETQH